MEYKLSKANTDISDFQSKVSDYEGTIEEYRAQVSGLQQFFIYRTRAVYQKTFWYNHETHLGIKTFLAL